MSAPALEAWKALAIRAIGAVCDAERETNWGSATFGPSIWEQLRAEQDKLLHAAGTELGE